MRDTSMVISTVNLRINCILVRVHFGTCSFKRVFKRVGSAYEINSVTIANEVVVQVKAVSHY